jgi:hypothetical protein
MKLDIPHNIIMVFLCMFGKSSLLVLGIIPVEDDNGIVISLSLELVSLRTKSPFAFFSFCPDCIVGPSVKVLPSFSSRPSNAGFLFPSCSSKFGDSSITPWVIFVRGEVGGCFCFYFLN